MENFKIIEVKEGILSENERMAQENRQRLAAAGTFMLNLMSSPGAGKTSLILASLPWLSPRYRIGVIEADIDSSVDAQKIEQAGIQVLQLRTGGFCHLDASMVASALEAPALQDLDLLFLENVGNLVCPAEFDTGAAAQAMILSLPEGDDKPLKYPLIFSVCQALVVNKVDYAQLAEFDLELLSQRAKALNPELEMFPVSCRSKQGLEPWARWLEQGIQEFKQGQS
ncbi:MAG: hydrogenase nickel incorporation protein HypB [Desulfohalobiaceae bacterium]